MNIELLRQVESHFREHPSEGRMETWEDRRWRCLPPFCGTTCCIAGRGLATETPVLFATLSALGNRKAWQECGERLYELTTDQANELFYASRWPAQWQQRYASAPKSKRGLVMADFIDYFIAREETKRRLALVADAREAVGHDR